MRVLIAHNRYRVPGGEERHVELLEQGLREAGVEVRRFERSSDEIGSGFGAKLQTAVRMTYNPASAREIERVLDAWPADVVHVHNLFPLLTPSVLRAARRSGAALVMTVHNYRFACPAGTLLRHGEIHHDCLDGSPLLCGLRNPRGSLAESVAYGIALELHRRLHLLERWLDALVAPSEFMRGMLVRGGLPPERIRTIHNGLPLPAARDEQPAYALYAGRLAPEKGIETLLEAARLAPEVPLVVAGDGPLASTVRFAGGSVEYVGRVGGDELTELRARSAFAIVPSECHEALPYAAVESVAAGRPVVGTRMGGLPEIVEDGESGMLVEPGSPQELAAAMRRLWEEPAVAAALGRRARLRAAERFALESQTARVVDLYESLLYRRRPVPAQAKPALLPGS